MATAVLETPTAAFDVEDVEYLRHGDKPLLATHLQAERRGAVPGAWSSATAAPGA